MAQTTKATTKPKVTKAANPAAVAPAGTDAVVGYTRTSTVDQEAGLEGQKRDLAAAGCLKVFEEQVSSIGKRDQLVAALDYLREGDTLTVTKSDRLARSVADLLTIVAKLDSKGVALRVLSMGGSEVDTHTPTGRLMLVMLGAVAEFERTLMLERQKEGTAQPEGEGRDKGRKPTARAKAADVQWLREAGMTPTAIAAKLGVGRASVYRIMMGGGVSGPDSATLVPPVDADSLRPYAKQAGVASGAARREKAADYAAELAPILAELDPDGSMTLGQLASALTAREIPTMRGGPWSAVQVHRLKARMEGAA